MLSGLFQAICQVGIFMICAQTIVHFRPNGSYEKYLKMLVSVMLLIQIFLPITKMFSEDVSLQIQQRVTWFEQSMEEAAEKAAKSAFLSEDTLERMTLEEVQNRLKDSEGEKEENREAMGFGAEKENVIGEESRVGEGRVREVEKIRVKVGDRDEAEGKSE